MMLPVWEYHLEPLARLTADHLNELGAHGWELSMLRHDTREAIFKRPGPDYRERITIAQRERLDASAEETSDEIQRSGILHPGIARLLASTGHTDYFLITDRGFPAPPEPERIDLALVDNLPTVVDVLRAVHEEFVVDRVVITEEMERFSPGRVAELRALPGDITVETVPHIELKRLGHDANATIRTGDTTPYANVIVVSG